MEVYDEYLLKYHETDIASMLATDDQNGAMRLSVDLCHMHRVAPDLFQRIVKNAWVERQRWNASLQRVQYTVLSQDEFLRDAGSCVRGSCYVILHNLPMSANTARSAGAPRFRDVGKLIRIKGNVVRMSTTTKLEFKRRYICSKCKKTEVCHAQYYSRFRFETPEMCPNATGAKSCHGTMRAEATTEASLNAASICYQELSLQEPLSHSRLYKSIIVTLEEDLVDSCDVGDCVEVCGVIQSQMDKCSENKKQEVRLVLRAISVYSKQREIGQDFVDEALHANLAWHELVEKVGEAKAREEIVSSFCPNILGMQCVKLALCIVLCSGDPVENERRQNSHILLIGDPSMGKSKLIKFAYNLAGRAVFTTGERSTKAGLTAAAVREDNEWLIEPGALVLADDGFCFIDEFHLLSKDDMGSLHECMEQQTLSMAKAGLMCTRRTRCSVIAAMNPFEVKRKGKTENEIEIASVGLKSPLLSRFDVIYYIKDEFNENWDKIMSQYILETKLKKFTLDVTQIDSHLWDEEKLQAHFLMVQDIHATVPEFIQKILKTYFELCRDTYDGVERGRTTYRLLNSLERLTKAHAKLMARTQVHFVDAVAAIYLVESSWGYGGILPPIRIMTGDIPYPNAQMEDYVLETLSLTRDDLGHPQPPTQGNPEGSPEARGAISSQRSKRPHPDDSSPEDSSSKRNPLQAQSSDLFQYRLRLNLNLDSDEESEDRTDFQSGFLQSSIPLHEVNLDLDDEDEPNQRHAIKSEEPSQSSVVPQDDVQSSIPRSYTFQNVMELGRLLESSGDESGQERGQLWDASAVNFNNIDFTLD